MSHPLDQPVGARYLSWSLHSHRYVYDVSSVTTISGVCPPHRRLQFHVAFTHVSHWPHTLQCLPRNSFPTCLKNRLKRWPERGPAPLLDSNVCCDVCCSYQDYACPFSRTFPEFASTYCLPGRAFRHPLFTDRPLRRNLASSALLVVISRLARFVSSTFTILIRLKWNWAEPSAACFCTAHPCRINSQVERHIL